MHSSLLLLGTLAASAFGQAITFSNTTFTAPVKVGAQWAISYSAGNGQPVAIAFGNETYAFQVVDGLTAPGKYDWTVAVPANVVAGTYQLALLQDGSPAVFSPAFNLEIPDGSSTTDATTTTVPFPAAPTATVTAIYLPYPVNATYITYIYYEEACGCHQTSSCPVSAMPTSTAMTTATYYEHQCGCTTTVEAPCAETVIPVSPVAPATNTPMAPTVAPAAPASPASPTTAAPMPAFTGAGYKLAGSGAGLAALAAALVLA